MKIETQENIRNQDLANRINLRVDFYDQILESELDIIEGELHDDLLELGVGFGSALGVNFIQAGLLDFGVKVEFKVAKKIIEAVLEKYKESILCVYYLKAEIVSRQNFISESILDFAEICKNLVSSFEKVKFNPIKNHTDSPEKKSLYGEDDDSTISIWMSEFELNNKTLTRIIVGSKELSREEINTLKIRLSNSTKSTINQVKWNGFEWNFEHEIWEYPKHKELFEVLK